MKKYSIYAFMSAIALTGAVSFSSCSSSNDDVGEVNPKFNPQTNEVLTQFLFNVSTGNTASTRQSAEATQATTGVTFRGIEDSHILCFKKTDTNVTGNWIASGETTVDRDYPMEAVVAPASLSSSLSRRVLEMSLPLKTNTMMFYGRATKNTDKNAYGYLSKNDGNLENPDKDGYNILDNMTGQPLNNISFHLGKRLTSAKKVQYQQTQKLLAAVLTCVMNVRRGTDVVGADAYPNDMSEGSGNPYKFAPAVVDGLTWASYVYKGNSPVTTSSAMYPLEEKMARAHYEMTNIKSSELRNASGPAIIAMIEDLWTIVNAVRYADPINVEEATAKYMAELVNLELRKFFTATVPNNGGTVHVDYINSASAVVTALGSDTNWPTGEKPTDNDFTSISAITQTNYLSIFPANFDLPQGATHILYNTGTKVFSYAESFSTSAVGGGSFTVDDYYFPPELLYFGNSPIRVSDQEHVVGDYPQNTAAWDDANSWPATGNLANGDKIWTTPGEVLSSTRSVAMKNDINYGTALLKTKVSFASGVTLEDNNHYIQDHDYHVNEPNHLIEPTSGLFTLEGILVGGQYPKVGWDFLPVALGSGEHTGYVYDNSIVESEVPTPENKENYTLVFDNYKPGSGTGDQDKVYVALEFKNNGPDFFGRDNLITNGSNFYLIGELDPRGKSITNWPQYHALPPYTNGTTMAKVPRVFIQDYMTTANFVIGQYSLQYAYLTVPDLRASSVTLGLSVDLIWSTGLNFTEVVIGGSEQYPPQNNSGN